MLLKSYRLEMFNNGCMPGAMSVQCFAHLDQDVGMALPYLNSKRGGFEYIKAPPSVTFRVQGKLITIHRDRIAINALKDEAEARKIVNWLQRELNSVWENRASIDPLFEGSPRPKIIEILKRLPKSNCGTCGFPTCMVFASLVAEGAKDAGNCPALSNAERTALYDYMERFHFTDL